MKKLFLFLLLAGGVFWWFPFCGVGHAYADATPSATFVYLQSETSYASHWQNPLNMLYTPDTLIANFDCTGHVGDSNCDPLGHAKFAATTGYDPTWGNLIGLRVMFASSQFNGNVSVYVENNGTQLTGCAHLMPSQGNSGTVYYNYLFSTMGTTCGISQSALQSGTAGISFVWYYGSSTTMPLKIDAIGMTPLYDNYPDQSIVPVENVVTCQWYDLSCIFSTMMTNIVNFFTPDTTLISSQFSGLQSTINNKAPFAYANAVFSLNLSMTGASATVPAISIPVYAQYQGHTILNSHLTLSDGNNNLGNMLSYIRPVFVIMLWIGFIFFLIVIARDIMKT